MGTLLEKLTYLSNAVDDIQSAINEKDVNVDDTIPLGEYGNKIREIKTAVAWADYTTMNGYKSVTEEDFVVKDVINVTDLVFTGAMEGVISKDYSTYSGNFAYTEQDLVCKSIEDATDTIEIIQINYTNL